MKTLKKFAQRLWNDESAQGVSEYILLLVVVIALAVIFKEQIKGFVQGKLGEIGGGIGSFGQGEMGN